VTAMTMATTMKHCASDLHEGPDPVPVSNFYKNNSVQGGLESKCKTCRNAHYAQVFDYYGHACACCGTTENLSVDHVDGQKAQHFAQAGLTNNQSLYRWLIAQGFPDGFQVLCMPCNASKRQGRACRLIHDTVSDTASARITTWFRGAELDVINSLVADGTASSRADAVRLCVRNFMEIRERNDDDRTSAGLAA
jgi:hypothetical protein